ncbi:SDR family NAD(P)-dependent oxidoreductase [Williamsia sp.]|uniref:SDR family NAD(P)-dependent oxidoreductase n=1 Tax=Williamsia sp. TaxID=1872085 RepID=UPI002F931354
MAVLDRDTVAAHPVATDVRAEGAKALAVAVDVSDQASVNAAFDTARKELGSVGILVTTEGVSGFTPLDDTTPDEWNHYIAVNLTSLG